MTVDSVAIHHAEHPEPRHPGQLPLDAVTVLVHFSHLGDEARPRLHANSLDNLGHEGRQTSRVLLLLGSSGFRTVMVRGGALPPNIYPCEVSTLLQASSILRIYLDHIVPSERG